MDAPSSARTPAWRLGCWLSGVALLLVVPLGRGRQGLLETAAVLAAGLVLTAPHGLALLRGTSRYRPPESTVRLRPVGVATYLLYLVVVRLPVRVGDVLYSAVWGAVGETRTRRVRTRPAAVASTASYGEDEPTWPPLGPLPGDRDPERDGLLGRLGRRAAGRH